MFTVGGPTTKFLSLLLAFSLVSTLAGCPRPEPDTVLHLYEILDPNTDIAQVLQNDAGEQVVVLAEKTNGGEIAEIIGGACFTPSGVAVTFWFGENGLPLYAVSKGYLFHFHNYTSNTVDIIATAPDRTSLAINDVDIPEGQVTECLQAAFAKSTNGDVWRWISAGIGVVACGVSAYAAIQTAGVLTPLVYVGCGGAALSILANVLDATGVSDFGLGAVGTVLQGVSTLGACMNIHTDLGVGCGVGLAGLSAEQIGDQADQAEAARDSVIGGGEYGGLRFVLTWGASPSDLDSHLWTPPISGQNHHIYFANRNSYSVDVWPYADLDVDDTSSYGPETVTIAQLFPGTYRYSVYNYSGSPAIGTSGAKVAVFNSLGLIGEYRIATSGSGRWWHVFEIDGATGSLRLINTINDQSNKDFDPLLAVK